MMTAMKLGTATLGLAVALAGNPSAISAQSLDSLTVSYEVAGLKVIHRPIKTNDVVAVNLYLLGGSRQARPATAGIELFLLHASEYGTKNYPGEAARRRLAHTGSWIGVGAAPDYSRFTFRGIKQEFDSTWAVFADRIMHPTLDSAAVEIARAQLLTSVRRERESPQSFAALIADSLAHESHPYAVRAMGTETSLAAINAADLRAFATEQMVTSRMLLVVVGDISRERLEKAITSTLGTLPRGNYTWTLPQPWTATAPRVVSVQRRLPTNYIFGYFSGPQQSSPDYPAFSVATSYIGGLLHDFVRSEGLSYSAGARTYDYGATGGGVWVSTVRPDSVVKIINLAIDFMQKEAVPRAAMLRAAKTYEHSYYYNTESYAEQASMLGMAQLYYGNFRAGAEYGQVLKKVTGGDIRRAAREYVKNIQYGFVGDTTKVPLKTMMKQP